MKLFLDRLEYYSIVSVQPANLEKNGSSFVCACNWSPKFDIALAESNIKWVMEFKHLEYWITPKIGWSSVIDKTLIKIRQRVSMVNSFRCSGTSSLELRKTLLLSYVFPLFTGLFILYPLFTHKQRDDLSHFYYLSLRRIFRCLHWSDIFSAYAFDEISLKDSCLKYWDRYLVALADTTDGELIFEQGSFNQIRKAWLQKEFPIKDLFRSKRYVEHISVIEQCLQWCSANRSSWSIVEYDILDVYILEEFADTF